MKHEKACGAVIINDHKVLLVHQQNDLWGFPKGHVEPGESEVETALREVKEETDLDIIIDNTRKFPLHYYIPHLDVQKEVVLFLATLKNPNQSPSRQETEIAELRWIPLNEVSKYLNFPEWQTTWTEIYATLQ